jgi:mono/diheme cytochrome c family protein
VKTLLAFVFVLVAVVFCAGAYVYSGLYDIGADVHHSAPVQAVVETLRDRSIERRAADIDVPVLDDGSMILKGSSHYAAMCSGCHLEPGVRDSEIRPGLYPQPPNLSRVRVDPKTAFWVIKHGIKMSAMPAWGTSHDDATIWSMVAFLQKLPDMTPEQYKAMIATAPPDEDMDMGDDEGHSHDGGQTDAGDHAHADVNEEEHDHAASAVVAALSFDGFKP